MDNTDSDSDEYIDINSNVEINLEDIYQFIINNEKLELNHIGKFSKAPDIIIKENFGKDSNMNLYSCVYTYNELMLESNQLYFPLVKLIIKNKLNVITTSIIIKLNKNIIINNLINNIIDEWELYWLENKSDLENIKIYKIEKNINSTNIIEKIIEYSINN